MFNLKSNSVKKYDRSVPGIQFENKEIELELGGLFNTDKNIYYYLGLLLLRLGFEADDNIMLCNYNKENYSFDCIVDNECVCNVRFNNIYSDEMEIVVSKFNNEFGYKCEPLEVSEIGMKVSLSRYSYKCPDGLIFTRYLSRDNIIFKIEMCGYSLELELGRPSNLELPLFDTEGQYAKYRLDKEEELVKYLSSLSIVNLSIVYIYNELCGKYLGDVSLYSEFILKKCCEDKVIDLIHLKNGNLEKFRVTEYGRTVFIDKDNNWSYEMPQEGTLPVKFSMTSSDGEVNCMFSYNEDDYDIEQYMNGLIKTDVEIAMNEVVKTKRNVRTMFKSGKGSK